MDDEWEEEEQLVVVELSGVIDNHFLSRSRTCKILDIDSEKPIMQLGQYVFAGEYEETLGTCVLFEDKQQERNSSMSPDLHYLCHTTKKLTMQRIFVTDKQEGEGSTVSEGEDGAQKNASGLLNEGESHPQEDLKDKMETSNLEASPVD